MSGAASAARRLLTAGSSIKDLFTRWCIASEREPADCSSEKLIAEFWVWYDGLSDGARAKLLAAGE